MYYAILKIIDSLKLFVALLKYSDNVLDFSNIFCYTLYHI